MTRSPDPTTTPCGDAKHASEEFVLSVDSDSNEMVVGPQDDKAATKFNH